MKPIISVIVLTYNNFGKIEDTFYSIINQAGCNYEIIVSDDGSEILDEEKIKKFSYLAAKRQIPFYYRRNEQNQGTVKNINQALELVHGSYLAFLCPGDFYIDSGVLSDVVSRFEENSYLIVTSKMVFVDCLYDERPVIKPNEKQCELLRRGDKWEILGKIANGHFIPAPATFYNRDIYKLVGKYNEEFRLMEDYPFLFNSIMNGIIIDTLDRMTVCYRSDGISNFSVRPQAFEQDLELMRTKVILPVCSCFKISDRRLFLFHYRRKYVKTAWKKFLNYLMNPDLDFYWVFVKIWDMIRGHRFSDNKDINQYRWWIEKG